MRSIPNRGRVREGTEPTVVDVGAPMVGRDAAYDALMSSTPDPERWLITGANGFLGANLGANLDGRATRIGLTRAADSSEALFDESVHADLLSPGEVRRAVLAARPDVIVHAAAMASHEQCEERPDEARQVNAEATGHLAALAHELGARFVFISTDAVFDGQRGGYREIDDPSPTSVYGRTKLEGEEAALAETEALIIRTNFFGWSPSGRRSILEFFVRELSEGHRVKGFTDFTTTSTYAQDLADALTELVRLDSHGIFHVTSPDALTKYEFGVAVAAAFDLDPALITPTPANIHPPRNGDISLCVEKVEEVLGRRLPKQRDGLARARQDDPVLRLAIQAGGRP